MWGFLKEASLGLFINLGSLGVLEPEDLCWSWFELRPEFLLLFFSKLELLLGSRAGNYARWDERVRIELPSSTCRSLLSLGLIWVLDLSNLWIWIDCWSDVYCSRERRDSCGPSSWYFINCGYKSGLPALDVLCWTELETMLGMLCRTTWLFLTD